ncbi:hypothetical protein J2W28_003057 [Variovorax boronicumulans]|uniref:three component ABC system middle component n=1 Tax=Variovorax boronicumulans TaxID=436515 RepID=UPI002783E92F|nr:three component ABC system middle component [Variovorax boronicumulans]MDP9991880.1 hypothetical protein [Variovorax boronicumulans]MDQ0003908.1 hypothetical protein [Variovorax boronicumulans]
MIWRGYNNFGIVAVAIYSAVEAAGGLSISKAVVVAPLVMHKETMKLFKGNFGGRGIAALVSSRPELFLNFRARFEAGLPVSFNAIQYLISTRALAVEGSRLGLVEPMLITKEFGERAKTIKKVAPKIATLLDSPVDEIYLNLRIVL